MDSRTDRKFPSVSSVSNKIKYPSLRPLIGFYSCSDIFTFFTCDLKILWDKTARPHRKPFKKSRKNSEIFYFLYHYISHSRALIGQQWIKKKKHVSIYIKPFLEILVWNNIQKVIPHPLCYNHMFRLYLAQPFDIAVKLKISSKNKFDIWLSNISVVLASRIIYFTIQ